MMLTERIVLFHDSPPFGKNLAQMMSYGLGVCRGVVVLPDISLRVQLEHRAGIERFAQRMAPACCVGLDAGSRLVWEGGVLVRGEALRLTRGGVEQEWRP